MEVLGRYSNHSDQGGRLDRILKLAPEELERPKTRTLKRICRQLDEQEVADLVACYSAGVLLDDLASTFQVNQTTIQKYVRAHGLPRRSAMVEQRQLDEVVQLYGAGRSVDFIAARLGIGATTVRRALVKAKVTIRRRGRPRRLGTQAGRSTDCRTDSCED
ncbi:MAG: hypothetical protein ACLP62_03335 [Acidimicrobiales bacterium]